MKKLLLIAVVMALTGCTAMYRGLIAERGAATADALLEDALWVICKATPVGAIKRRFSNDAALMGAYNTLCTNLDNDRL